MPNFAGRHFVIAASYRPLRRFSPVVALAVLLTACNGGSSSPPSFFTGVAATPSPAPSVTPSPVPTATPQPTTATLTLAMPAAVTSATLRITVKTINGQPPTSAQIPQNPATVALSSAAGGNCTVTAQGETCTGTTAAAAGTFVVQFDVLDAGGNTRATNTATFQVQPGSNQFSAQLDGVVATVTIATAKLTPGTAFSGPIAVSAFDSTGALITGSVPYAYAFTITDNDASTHTSLTLNATTGKTVTTTNPNDTVILNYDGTTIASFTYSVATVNGPKPISGGGTTTVGP